jgi:two-component system sensor histidine kinase ChvG
MTAAQKFPLKGSAVADEQAKGQVILGEDWVSPEVLSDKALQGGRGKRGLFALNKSPLARKIILFNLLALVLLVAGVLFLNPFRDNLVLQREAGLVSEARLLADVMRTRAAGTGGLPADLSDLSISAGVEVFLLDPAGIITARGVVCGGHAVRLHRLWHIAQ